MMMSNQAVRNPAASQTPPSHQDQREVSVTRGRAYSASSKSAANRTHGSQPRVLQSQDGLERRPSASYGHHRQTSIVHGVQHMRNPSSLAQSSTSPLSPHSLYAPASHESSVLGYSSGAAPHLRKSPSASALSLQSAVGSMQSDMQGTVRRHANGDRSHSSKPSRDPDKNRTASRHKHRQPDLTTVGEYALHHLLTNFIKEADERIERCMSDPNEAAIDIEAICGPGADFGFDQLIKALGHIGRDRPKSMIDSVMLWRRGKGDVNQTLHRELEKARNESQTSFQNSTVRRGYNHTQASINGSVSSFASGSSDSRVAEIQLEIRKAERRSAISVYILCRALMEIIGQCRPGTLPDETSDRLEEVIWMQVRTTDAQSHGQSSIKQAQWNMFGQLLGVMSGPRFMNIRDRYLNELGSMQPRLSMKGHMDLELERKAGLMVDNMSWLKVRITPDSAWDQSCELIKILANYFANVHGRTIKHAYCQLFDDLLLPIAAKATAQLNSVKWRGVLEVLRPKINQLLLKPKHWTQAFPLLTVTLCTSPAEIFNQNWYNTALNLQPKLRDRATRSHALKALCRLVWRYLYRIHDPQPTNRLEDIVKMIFQPGKRAILSTEPSIADPLIQLIRIIGFRCQEFCFRNIIFPLMNIEAFKPGKENKIEALEPERMVIGIRAYLAIMADLEKQEQPKFPLSFECDALLDPYNRSPHSHRRSASQTSISVATTIDRFSKPVDMQNLTEVTRGYHMTFCRILGDICKVCDNAFGGQAVLDEKLAHNVPKTPMSEAFAFGRRDDIYSPTDVRQIFYDLLHVAVQALPRCILPETPFNPLVNLLCTGTAHVQSHIASSSSWALRSIAKEPRYSQRVATGFSRFIFNFNDKYSTVADGGLLGAQHIESTLRIYVELLEIWIEELQKDSRAIVPEVARSDSTSARSAQDELTRSGTFAHVDEVEAHGLFFLCSPSRHVRTFAIRVLRLVTKFDEALGRPSVRIISILEGSSQQVIDVNDEKLTTAERSRLQKGLRKSNVTSTLVELCSSDIPHDSTLWVKVFPGLIRLSQVTCPQAVSITRGLVCARLVHIHPTMSRLAEPQMDPTIGARFASRHALSPAEVTIEQWKLHLIYACTTLTDSSVPPAPTAHHTRKSSKNGPEERITSASELFTRIVSFLGASNERVRVAAAVGLGTIGANLFRPLMESLHPLIVSCVEEGKLRLGSHQRSISSPRRFKRTDYFRTEITHLYRLTTHCLSDEEILDDTWILHNLVTFTKDLRIFLNDHEVQHQLTYQKLRTHFCGLIEALYEATGKTKEPLRWMSFQSRKAAFSMMEEWCGYSPNQGLISQREDMMKRSMLDSASDVSNRGGMTAALEIEKKDLRMAALSAMASLCAGPVSMNADGHNIQQFDVKRMLQWIDTIFNDTPSDKTHTIGRRALKNLITFNPDHTYLLTRSLEMCYVAHAQPKTLTSYFDVVTQVLQHADRSDMPFWKILCAGLYTLGNEKSDIRVKSIRLLRTMEERLGKSSKLQDLDISVSDKTTAVYKLAQFQISQRLSREHPVLAFHVFSEFSTYFKDLHPDHQRNMVSAMLPWLQTVELQVHKDNRPTASSHMLLVNLVEITVRSSNVLHNEIQALWQALATGPHGGNVQVVLDFIIAVCLDRREQNFVEYAKQVVVFLSGTPAGSKVIEFLLLQLTPRSMINDKEEPLPVPTDSTGLPYIADLNQILPMGAKQSGLSLGQLSLMLLVDLVVSPVQLPQDKVPALLQTAITQWDHYTGMVSDQAREMLVHLIHELVISKIEPGSTKPDKASIEELIESIRQHDPKVTWGYEEGGTNSAGSRVSGVPDSMAYIIDELVRVFTLAFELHAPDFQLQQLWAKTTLEWATSCPVRHVACRSFQIYRCILQNPDHLMLSDMLARLSDTIADDDNDYLTFSQEILMTLRTIINRLEPVEILKYPQLFWITAACLDTIYEEEFNEGLTMLEQLLDRLDLSDPALVKLFFEHQPPHWEGEFEGLQSLVYKGLRSGICLDRSLRIMERMIKLPPSELVGRDDRLLFTVLGNLPVFLMAFEDKERVETCARTADILASVADSQGHDELSDALSRYATASFKSESEFLGKVVSSIRLSFFPRQEFDSLVFLIGLLNNQISWFKIKTMKLLCIILPDVDMRKPEFASQGPDLISPLLRLLQTSYCQQALDVLDNVMSMTGTPLDQKHIRMSMAGSHSSRATRKEYDSTKSLYGIPEESGWSIPMPAIQSARVRNNVSAVARTCARPGSDQSNLAGTPKVEFKDDQHYSNYFPNDSALMLPSDSRPSEGNMSELVMKLDSLDDFFDDQEDDQPQGRNSIPRYSNIITEDRETLYDKHTLPILHKSLDRNASVTSFQGSFADPRWTSPRDQSGMNPSAFSSTTNLGSEYSGYSTAASSRRPGFHNRSITSPAAGLTKQNSSRSDHYNPSEDDADSERQDVLSDDDLTISRTWTQEEMYPSASSPVDSPYESGHRTHKQLHHANGSSVSLPRAAGLGVSRPPVRRMASAQPDLHDQNDRAPAPASRTGLGGTGVAGAFSPVSTFSPFVTSSSAPPVTPGPQLPPPAHGQGREKSPQIGVGFMEEMRRDVDEI